jgi:nucleotide-binding universal stress UspA family protein
MAEVEHPTRAPKHLPQGVVARCPEPDGSEVAGPVLVAVDLSRDSRAALLWAGRQPPNPEAPVKVLHVLHDPADAPGRYIGAGSDLASPMINRAEEMLAEFMSELRDNHPELKRIVEAETKVVAGLPAQTIVGEAVRLGASLIVVGSRDQTGPARMMHGSTSQKVTQLSPIPVTVVKAS